MSALRSTLLKHKEVDTNVRQSESSPATFPNLTIPRVQSVRRSRNAPGSTTSLRMTSSLSKVWGRSLARFSASLTRTDVSPFSLVRFHDCLPAVIVKASSGPRYVVGCRTKIDKAKLVQGTRVALDMTTLTVTRPHLKIARGFAAICIFQITIPTEYHTQSDATT